MERNQQIDVLKGIAIISIIVQHYNWTALERRQLLFPFWINMAVPVFMIISGYLYAASLSNKKIGSLKMALRMDYITGKFLRYTIPFSFIYVIDFFHLFDRKFESKFEFIYYMVSGFARGGGGPGGYYYPVMLQCMFLIPVLYCIIKRYDFGGLIICFLLNFIFEFYQRFFDLPEECYRLLCFRYTFVIGFGIWLFLGRKLLKRIWRYFFSIVGGGFIAAVSYWGYIPKLIRYWSDTSFVACLFLFFITPKFLHKKNKICKWISCIGKASYNIFLVQKAYYGYFAEYMYGLGMNRVLELFVFIIICVFVGLLFYFIETPITKWITKKRCVLSWTKNIYWKMEKILLENQKG